MSFKYIFALAILLYPLALETNLLAENTSYPPSPSSASLPQNQDSLRIANFELFDDSTVRINWTGADTDVVIEYANSLIDPEWRPLLGEGFELRGNSFTVQLQPGLNGRIFLRIRVPSDSPVPLTTFASSPHDQEEGVAVTRETIVEFSRPLQDSVDLGQETVRASFSGRDLPARLHLSRDRKRITLFYLDPLPASARIRVRVDGDLLTDDNGRALDSDGDGIPGGTRTIEFKTLDLASLPGTAVVGRVFASELADTESGETSVNVPLENVTITVDAKDKEMKAVTDANGNFRLYPAPAGRFFVHIDGRTAANSTSGDAYYPFVGKAWKSIPGEESDVGDIYLPLVANGTLQNIQPDDSTSISFPDSVLQEHPELNGVSINVPPNALLNDDGTRGGKVGIAPVPPDRLPGPRNALLA